MAIPFRPSSRSRGRLAGALAIGLAAAGVAPQAAAQAAPGVSCIPPTFGRMFNTLPGARWSTDAVGRLAAAMSVGEARLGPEGKRDAEENADLARFDAGLTYAGQFIDHDITLDPRPNDLTTPINPYSLPNRRTPRLDLDSVYGNGPAGSPQLYEADQMHLRLGAALAGTPDAGARDLPRDANGQAIIGDPRNDENVIVAQLHAVFLRFHNLWVDRVRAANPRWTPAQVFAEARRQVTLSYHYAILTDFLPAVVGAKTMSDVFPQSAGIPFWGPSILFYDMCRAGMPVEFAVAAYRFGHSIVRPAYRLNTSFAKRLPIFAPEPRKPLDDAGGFRPIPRELGIDWRFFFDLGQTVATGFPQAAYKPDAALVKALENLPFPERGTESGVLGKRNLLRAMQLGLPSGQDVARAMGFTPLRDEQIVIGTATGDPTDAQPITAISPEFAGRAPLWVYVLAEASANAFAIAPGAGTTGTQRRAMTLGPVGGRIVAETFAGLLQADNASLLANPFYLPPADMRDAAGRFGFRDIVRAVLAKAGHAAGSYGGVTSLVWVDTNRDGKLDEDDERLPGVTLTLIKPGGASVTVVTNADGEAFFGALGAGPHRVCVTGGLPAGAIPFTDADGIATLNCSSVTLGTDGVSLVQDFGYRR